MGIHYQLIGHLDRTIVTSHDNNGDQLAAGQALRIMQLDFEAAYDASKRHRFEQTWKELHPILAGHIEDMDLPLAE